MARKDRIWDFESAKVQSQMDMLLYELYKAEDEEEASMFLIRLHLDNRSDLQFFTPEERDKVRQILTLLIRETAKHRDLLGQAIKEVEEKFRLWKEKGR